MTQYDTHPHRRHEGTDSQGGGGTAPESAGALLCDAAGNPRHVRMVVVGSGFGGLCMAIKLKEAGIHDFVVLERSHEVGGTWRDNTYPGCECDVPSHLYSYSFDLNPGWPRPFAAHDDIQAYIRRVTDRYGLREHIQFGANVGACVFDEAKDVWRVETSLGPISADTIAAAPGGLSNPSIPELPGLETFEGESFHSARWNHDYDFTGKRVAVIGSGASTIQFLPRIAPKSQHLTLFQRTPSWVMPKDNRPFSPLRKWAFEHVPLYQRLYRGWLFGSFEMVGVMLRNPWMTFGARRLGTAHIRKHIADPELRAKLTPSYTPGCKRILLSSEYYPALARQNVDVCTTGIREIRPRSIVTEDGVEHEVDVIVFGTGFDVHGHAKRPNFVGRGGLRWQDAPMEAYMGVFMAGFPNLFMLGGPNSALGHNSIIIMIEGAVRQTMMALRLMESRTAATIEVSKEVQDAYNVGVQRKLANTVWTSGCSSYYADAEGKVIAIWPGSVVSYKTATRTLDESQLQLGGRAAD